METVRGFLSYSTLRALFSFVIKVVIVAVIFVHWEFIHFWIYMRYLHVLRLVEDIANHLSSKKIEFPNGNTGEDSLFIIIHLHEQEQGWLLQPDKVKIFIIYLYIKGSQPIYSWNVYI